MRDRSPRTIRESFEAGLQLPRDPDGTADLARQRGWSLEDQLQHETDARPILDRLQLIDIVGTGWRFRVGPRITTLGPDDLCNPHPGLTTQKFSVGAWLTDSAPPSLKGQ